MLPSNEAKLDRLFGRVAPVYDRQLLLERAALRLAVRLAGPLDGQRVLDLATGTGALAAALLSQRCEPPAELIAIDRSVPMLERARGRLAAFEGRCRIRVLAADARALPVPSASLDLVTSGYVLHLLEHQDARAVLGEVRRVLRSGGRMVTVVHSVPPRAFGTLYEGGWRLLRRVLSIAGPGPIGDARPLLDSAGFSTVCHGRTHLGYWSQVVLSRAR